MVYIYDTHPACAFSFLSPRFRDIKHNSLDENHIPSQILEIFYAEYKNKSTKLYHRRTGPVCPGCQRPGGRGRTPPLGTCRGPPSLSPGESPPSLTTASCANGTSPAESSWPTPRQIPVMVK